MYKLRLYITGATPNSIKAVENLKQICAKYLAGNYDLEVIDIYQQPMNLKTSDILTTPSLIKLSPLPVLKLNGDLSNTREVLAKLNVGHS